MSSARATITFSVKDLQSASENTQLIASLMKNQDFQSTFSPSEQDQIQTELKEMLGDSDLPTYDPNSQVTFKFTGRNHEAGSTFTKSVKKDGDLLSKDVTSSKGVKIDNAVRHFQTEANKFTPSDDASDVDQAFVDNLTYEILDILCEGDTEKFDTLTSNTLFFSSLSTTIGSDLGMESTKETLRNTFEQYYDNVQSEKFSEFLLNYS